MPKVPGVSGVGGRLKHLGPLSKIAGAAPKDLLIISGVAQLFWSALLGASLYLPDTGFGKNSSFWTNMRSGHVSQAHGSWVSGALAQIAASYILSTTTVAFAPWVAYLLVLSGWAAPVAGFLRGFGFNSRRGGDLIESVIGLISLVATIGTALAWGLILFSFLGLAKR